MLKLFPRQAYLSEYL